MIAKIGRNGYFNVVRIVVVGNSIILMKRKVSTGDFKCAKSIAFLIAIAFPFLIFCILEYVVFYYDDLSKYRDEWFPDMVSKKIDSYPLVSVHPNTSYHPLLGYEGYQVFSEFNTNEDKNLIMYINKDRDSDKYTEFYDGIMGAIKRVNKPSKTQDFRKFLEENNDDLVFGIQVSPKAPYKNSRYNISLKNSSYGVTIKKDRDDVFFYWGIIYSPKLKQLYFIRTYYYVKKDYNEASK